MKEIMPNGLAIFPGNHESPMNYPANPYRFRQDSNFLYFFGLDLPGLAAVIDFDTGREIIYGNDPGIDDIIWMGAQVPLKEMASDAGVSNVWPSGEIARSVEDAISKGRQVHILPPYRAETGMDLSRWLDVPREQVIDMVSLELIRAVVSLRSVKDEHEIRETENALEIAYRMHTTMMKMAEKGKYEREIAAEIEGIALTCGNPVPFPIILSTRGEILHNHDHSNILEPGKLLLTDAGAESSLHYPSDITRTVPVGRKFDSRQKDIYDIVLQANLDSIDAVRPGVAYRDLHLQAAGIMVNGLKSLGLMKGDAGEAVREGAHALFFPHGLGHMLGLDVHDMEGLGEDHVGYDDEVKRSDRFGTSSLRLGKRLREGYLLTVEPGLYFIPALIDLWKSEDKFRDFINYEKIETYRDFGGIRIEDDVLVISTGRKVLGKPIPKRISEIENL